jgi:hypothetical protein
MDRPNLGTFMASHGPGDIGLCQNDVAGCAAAVNAATQQLLFAPEVGDSGWIGSWAEIRFTASQADPFITTPFDVARIEALDLCTFPVPVSNQFFEYMQFGFGRWPKLNATCVTGSNRCSPIRAYDRGKFPTFSDVIPPDKIVRVYLSDLGDVGKRVLLQSLDGNDQIRYSLDGTVQVTGDMLTLVAPFVDSPSTVNKVTGIAKDITLGPVSFYEVDTVTLDSRLILTMQPGETSASYRRYYLGGLPTNCCNVPNSTSTEVQLTAICQLTYVPVAVITDWLIIPNVEALINKCQAIRFDGMDAPGASVKSSEHHAKAIRLLNGQSIHENGKLEPSINFAPFGNNRLYRQRIGYLV